MSEKIGADQLMSSMDPRASMIGGNRTSISRTSTTRHDPYQLNFDELRQEYVKDSNIKLPFAKSSFIHYAACPLDMKIGDLELENELVLTMELVQAPSHMQNTKLTDPKV